MSYTFSESDGSQLVCVTIHEPTNTSVELEFSLSVEPENGTAGTYVYKRQKNTNDITLQDHYPPDPTKELRIPLTQ